MGPTSLPTDIRFGATESTRSHIPAFYCFRQSRSLRRLRIRFISLRSFGILIFAVPDRAFGRGCVQPLSLSGHGGARRSRIILRLVKKSSRGSFEYLSKSIAFDE